MVVALLFPVARDALKHVVGETWAMSAAFAAIAIYAVRARARWRRSSGAARVESPLIPGRACPSRWRKPAWNRAQRENNDQKRADSAVFARIRSMEPQCRHYNSIKRGPFQPFR